MMTTPPRASETLEIHPPMSPEATRAPWQVPGDAHPEPTDARFSTGVGTLNPVPLPPPCSRDQPNAPQPAPAPQLPASSWGFPFHYLCTPPAPGAPQNGHCPHTLHGYHNVPAQGGIGGEKGIRLGCPRGHGWALPPVLSTSWLGTGGPAASLPCTSPHVNTEIFILI